MSFEVNGAGPRPGMDPNAYAMQYAQENGISVEEAKSQLRAKYGDPTPPPPGMANGYIDMKYTPDRGTAHDVSPQQVMLLRKGIPSDVILQGDDVVRKYAEDHNISLSQPKANNTTLQKPVEIAHNNERVLYSLSSDNTKTNDKYQKLESKIEAKLNKKGKINPSQAALFDNSYSIVHKWIKFYMKENNVDFDTANDAFCNRFNCSFKKDSFGNAFFRN